MVVAHLGSGTDGANGELRYDVQLVRSFIGWKIYNIELIFASQQ
jgi:hypothetical protein